MTMRIDDQNWPKTIKTTNINGVFIIERPVYPDNRGNFQEVFRLSDLESVVGKNVVFRQINKSISLPHVLRGLHVATWGKLVHCYFGNVYQVVVDCRKDSSTFKEVFTLNIGDDNPKSVWVAPGCSNGFCVLGETKAVYGYSITAEYGQGNEYGLLWNDQELVDKIKWPISDPILSEKDKINKTFAELFST